MTNRCRYCHEKIDVKGLKAGAEICWHCTMSGVASLTSALKVLVLTPHIRTYLLAHDPKALAQAEHALEGK